MRSFITVAFFLMFSSLSFAKGQYSMESARDFQTDFHTGFELDHVIDGDTIVANGIKIRLWGIDAPEKRNIYFLPSKMLLESMLSRGKLTCKFIEKDRYKRHVMHCLIDGRDIGSMMVQVGMARDYSKYSGDYYQYEEDLAKAKKMGIWSDKVIKKEDDEQVMCTMDAKLCPDGSYVSRHGPNCEFASCPDESK